MGPFEYVTEFLDSGKLEYKKYEYYSFLKDYNLTFDQWKRREDYHYHGFHSYSDKDCKDHKFNGICCRSRIYHIVTINDSIYFVEEGKHFIVFKVSDLLFALHTHLTK